MKSNLSLHRLTQTLAALGVASLATSSALASPIHFEETDAATELDEDGDDGDDKKKKKHGDEGGCGAGSCS